MDSTEPQKPTRPFTAWHVFLVEILRAFSDGRRVSIRDFDKLGTLPLEADVILLLLDPKSNHDGLFAPELAWLGLRQRRITVVEFKSPRDALTRTHFDTTIAYAMLGKRKYEVLHNHDVSVVYLYSTAHGDLFDSLKEDGIRLEVEEPGVRSCQGLGLHITLVDLATFHPAQTTDPLLLVSSRHASFRPDPQATPTALALYQRLRYLIEKGKVHGMEIKELDGFPELATDIHSLRQQMLADMDPSERKQYLSGLPPSERMEGLAPSERLQGLAPSEVLQGLAPGKRDELLALLLGKVPG